MRYNSMRKRVITVNIGIIGGGASGMAAALAAAENPNVKIVLFERQARVGRKLQATGNGRCNLTNMHALQRGYHGEQADFSQTALEKFGPEETLHWFEGLGLLTVAEDSGRVYPYSDQANSVVDVLRFALEQDNIQVVCGCEITKVKKTSDGFCVFAGEETYVFDKLIIACGGLAGTKLGGSMSGYKLLAKFSHRSTKLRPALVQVKCAWKGVASLKGVRANCRISVCRDGVEFASSEGELQFTEYGLSGPVVFEVSRDVCTGGRWCGHLDFLPQISVDSLFTMLCRKRESGLPTDELLTGILHNRLGRVLTRAAGVGGGNICDMCEEELRSVCNAVKNFEVELTEPLGMDSAQVTAGGVRTEDFDPSTMESKLVPGLYACGEVLDVDGDCGGYNLQWAWSSGRLAGLSARGDAL